MINFKMTIDDVVVDNQYILDSIEFTTESGMQDYSVGSLFIPTVKTKLHNDVNITYNSTVKIFLIDEDGAEIPYGIFEPYEIKQSNLYRELTLYPQLYFTLTNTYNPVQDTLTTRQLVQNMQLESGFLVENVNDLAIVDMNGLKADSSMNLLKDIALVSATNIIINRNGKIEFKKVTSNSTVYTINGSNITEITKSDTVPYQITQVVGKADDNSETEEIVAGTASNKWNTMTITNAHMTQSIVNSIYTALSTVTYNGFELKIFNASINLEVLDKIKFTYKGTEYTIPVMDLTIVYSRGGLVAKIKANVSTALDKTTSHKGSVTSRLEVIKNITQELNTKLDIQDGQIQSLISQTTIIEDGQETTLKDKYSSISQDISGIKITVGSTETKLNQLEQEVKNNLSSYSILLSNENHVFPSDSNGKITEEITVTTDVTVHKGMNEVAFTIGTLPTVNGFTLSKTDKTITITANVGTLMADSGTIEIPITVDDIDFTKTFSYAKAKAGADNQNISVIGEQVFKYANNFTGKPTPETITLTLMRVNITDLGKWQYVDENGDWQDFTQNGVLQTGDTINIHHTSKIFGTTDAKTMRVRYYISDDMKDEMTLVKISDGRDGNDGTTIVNIKEQYYLSTSQQTLINGEWQDSAPTWESGKYIWTRTVFSYNNSTTSTTEPICVTGRDGLNGGISVSNVDVFYYQSTSATSLQSGSWSTNAPTWVSGKYVWTKTITYLDNGTQIESDAVCISGEKGQNAKNVSVSASAQIFKSIDGGQTYSPSSITLTPQLQNVTYSNWQYSTDGSTWNGLSNSISGWSVANGVLTINNDSSLFTSTVSSITFRVNTNDSAVYDTVTISRLFDITDLEIGGTNLAIGTNEGSSNWNWILQQGDKTVSSEVINGVNCVKLAKGNTTVHNGWDFVEYSKFARNKIKPNTTYIVSFEIKSNKTFDVTAIYLMYGSGADSLLESTRAISQSVIADSDWTKIIFELKTKSELPTTTEQVIYISGIKTDNDSVHYIKNLKLEKGNVATDWSPAPEDVDKNINDVKDSLSSFQDTVNNSFKDGIIEQAEAKAIEKYLQTLKAEKIDVDKEYASLYANSSLDGTAKTNLQSAKSTLDTKHTNLINAINTAISDGRTTSTEKTDVDNKFTEYNTALGTYRQMVQEALDYISTAKVDNIQVGGRNLWVLSDIVTGWVHTDGSITGTGDQHKTRQTLIPTNGAKELVCQCWNPNGTSNLGNANRIGFFDADMNYLGSYDVVLLNGDAYQQQVMNIPENAVWMRLGAICGSTDFYDETIKIKIELGNKATDWSPAPEDMENAYTIVLTNEAQVIPTDASRKPTASTTYYTDIQVYKGTAERTDYTIGTINSANGITVSKTASRVNFTTSTGTALSADGGNFTIPITIDEKTFNKVFSWSCSKQGSKGDKGESGNDAYTVILTNENHTFNAEQNGNIPNVITTTTKVIAYKGATSITPTIGTLPTATGLTITKNSDGVTLTIKANTGTSLANNGKIDIPITVDGKSFTKVFSWSKVNKGANAYSASIGASSQVFKSMDGGKTFTPNTITLTPILQNLSYSAWQYSTDGGSSWNGFTNSVSGWSVSGGVLTINNDCSLFTTNISSITVKLVANNSSYYDTMTIVKLSDVGELDIGSRNLLLATKGSKTIVGNNTTNQCTHLYSLYNSHQTGRDMNGRKVTLSFKYNVTSGATGSFRIQANGSYASPQTGGKWSVLSNFINVESQPSGTIFYTTTIDNDTTKGFNGIQTRMDNFNGSLTISECMLTYGNIQTGWMPAPEDIENVVEIIEQRVTEAEQKITDDAIISTVSSVYETKANVVNKINDAKNELMSATYSNLLSNSDFLTLENNFPRGYYSNDPVNCYMGGWICPEGGKTIHINTNNGGQWIGFRSSSVKARQDQVFTASVYVAIENQDYVGSRNFGLELEWLNADGNRISTTGHIFTMESVLNWERHSVTGTAPEGTVNVTIYCWHQTTGASWWGKPMLQIGSVMTAWDRGGDLETIEQRITSAEQKITDDAITNTVKRNFYTKTETDNAITSKGYATSSQVQQTADSLTATFTKSGGCNLFRNSGFKCHGDVFRFWYPWNHEGRVTSGDFQINRANDDWGFPSWLTDTMVIHIVSPTNTYVEYGRGQIIDTTIGKKYTVSCYYAMHRVTAAKIVVRNGDGNWIATQELDTSKTGGHHTVGNWGKATLTFTATSITHSVEFMLHGTTNDGYLWIAQPMCNEGDVVQPYTAHTNETYDGIIQMDYEGLKITSTNYGGYTHITSSGFYLNNGSRDIFKADSSGLTVISDPNTSINGDVIRSGNIVSNNSDLTFNLNSGQMYYKYTNNQVGFLGVTDGNSFSLSTDAKGWCMNSDYGSFSSMGAKSVNGGNYVPYLTVTSGGVSNYNAGIFLSMPLNYGSATGTNMTVKNALELSSKVSGAGLFNPKIAWRGSDVATGAGLFPRSSGDRIDIYTTGSDSKSDIYLRLADDVNTYFNITCNHYTYGHQSIATFRYVASIDGYGIDFYRGLNMHNYNLGNAVLKNARSVQTASLALLDDEATVQSASPTAMYALDNDIEATQATITQHIATSINKTVTFNGTELVEGTSEYIELPQDFLMCVDIQVTLTPNKLCRFAVTSKDEFGFVIETDTEGVTFDYVVIGTKMDGTLFASLHDVEPDTKPVIDEEEEFVKYTTDNLMLPQEFIDKGYTTFADATSEEMEAIKTEQVFGSPVQENNENEDENIIIEEDDSNGLN